MVLLKPALETLYLVGRRCTTEELEILAETLESFRRHTAPKWRVDYSWIHRIDTNAVLRPLATHIITKRDINIDRERMS